MKMKKLAMWFAIVAMLIANALMLGKPSEAEAAFVPFSCFWFQGGVGCDDFIEDDCSKPSECGDS